MEHQTETMVMTWDEKGFLVIRPNENFTGPETKEHSARNVEFAYAHFDETKLRGIVAFLPNHYINAEATRYYKENLPDVPVAFVGNSAFKKMLGNFLLKLVKPNRPMKLFTEEDEAVAWLEECNSEGRQ